MTALFVFLGMASAVAVTPLTTRELVEIRQLSGLAVSPDGAHAVVRLEQHRLAGNDMQLTWYLVPLDEGDPRPLTDAGEPLRDSNGGVPSETPRWSPDSQWIYFRKLRQQQVQVWRVRNNGSSLEQLTHDEADVDSFTVDADELRYTVRATRAAILAAEQAEYASGIVLDETIIPGLDVVRSLPVNGRLATYRLFAQRPDGWGTLLHRTPPRTYALDLDTGRTAPVAPLSNDIRLSLKKELASCGHSVCQSAQEIVPLGRWRKKEIVFKAATFGVEGLYVWDTRRKSLRTLIADHGVYGADDAGRGECRLTDREAICVASAADVPARLIAVDLQTGRRRVLFDPNPEFTAERLGIAETVVFSDKRGGQAYGRLLLPRHRDSGQRLPLVITSYTCAGFLLGGSGADVPEHVLVGQGFAALCLENSWRRRSPDPARRTSMELSSIDALEILENAIDVLAARGIVDPERVALTGLSAGASMTTYAISHSRRFAAAVITSTGYLDPINSYLYGARDNHRNSARSGKLPFPYADPEGVWARIAPALRAEQIDTPLLMQLSDVEYVPMMQLFSAMKDFGKPVEMVIFPDEYHLKHQPIHRLAVYDRNVDWLSFWLRGVEDENPVKAEQYRRWRSLSVFQPSWVQ